MKTCKECGQEMPEKIKPVIIDGWEYTKEDEQKGKMLSEIIIPEGWMLWDVQDCINLHNHKFHRENLNLNDCWFWIEQPFLQNAEEKYGSWFYADAVRANLSCGRDPQYSDAAIGVRFKRKVKK